MNTTKQPNKFTRFLRNNAALLLLVFCVLAIAAVVLAVTLTRDNPVIPDDPVVNNPNDDEPGNTTPGDDDEPTTPGKQKIQVSFVSPLSYTSVGMEYSYGTDHMFVFNSTLNEWHVHKGIDLIAPDDSEVVAMYDGTVVASGYSFLTGYYITVDHGDNVIATYSSLQDVQVQKGEEVKQGDVLGYVSTSAENEYKQGAHLHLEVTANGVNVDPMPYVNGEITREIEIDA